MRLTSGPLPALVTALCIAAAASIVSIPRPAGAPPSVTTITIFHETHTHGVLVKRDGVTFAHYAAVLKRVRATLEQPQNSLFVGNGDDLAAVIETTGVRTNGRHVIDAFAAAGLDADTYGFNELGLDPELLRELVRESRFAWVSANVRDPRDGDVFASGSGARRWAMRDIGGVRVGITGLQSGRGRPPAAFRVVDPVTAMREVVPEMRRVGAQVVVVLSHLAFDEIERVARDVPGVDVVVGSHVGPYGEPPRVISGVIVSAALPDMGQLGQLDLTVRGGTVAGHRYTAHAVTATATDAATDAVLRRYFAR